MLNQQLIDILNSGETWGFIGSGCSTSARLPSWEELLLRTKGAAESSMAPMPTEATRKFQVHKDRQELPEAFSILKSHFGGAAIESIVSSILDTNNEPGEVTKTLARWPFAAYITTNFDNLLERALEPFGGWIAIGNTAEENAKISGDVRTIVWHPHGGIRLGSKSLRLVLASTDYDEIYPAGSPTLNALEAVCRMKRLVFIGFGFKDPDLVMTLQRIGRMITPGRPAFGFLANCSQKDREAYWDRYKIDIISYSAKGHDHSDLLNELRAYGSFVLDRNTRFGDVFETPDYDISTVALLTHNRLARTGWVPENESINCLAQGFVLGQLTIKSSLSIDQLFSELPRRSTQAEQAIRHVIGALIEKGAIAKANDLLTLSSKGIQLSREGKADYERARDQFRKSIESRAGMYCSDRSLVPNVRDVTVNYLERTTRERGLGVAQQLVETGDAESRGRTVALLQGAKVELSSATNRLAALASIQCIWEVLTAPRLEEKRYLGFRTQAYFARHLLGIDPAAIGIQRANVSSTVFIADSSFIISLLAEGSIGHAYALRLFRQLISLGCPIVTSDLLMDECVEHARWAWDLLATHGSISATTIDAARGARGYRPNAFLLAYLNHPKYGPSVNFKRFFAHVFDSDGRPTDALVTGSLRNKGIIVQPPDKWQGFARELWTELEEVQQTIEQRRRRNSTFTHERQVKAEAEVALIVSQVRRHVLMLMGHETREAFFLSHSRVVDNLPRQAHRVCMTPESLFEWILSVGEINEDDANAIYDQLLWEISKEGANVVPRAQLLLLFHNMVNASRSKLADILSEHREIIREKYAIDPKEAFLNVDPLNIPILAEEVSRETLASMQARLADEQRRRAEAEVKAKATIKDEREYQRLKAEKKERQDRAKRKKRAAQSGSGGKKGKKQKKKRL